LWAPRAGRLHVLKRLIYLGSARVSCSGDYFTRREASSRQALNHLQTEASAGAGEATLRSTERNHTPTVTDGTLGPLFCPLSLAVTPNSADDAVSLAVTPNSADDAVSLAVTPNSADDAVSLAVTPNSAEC
ncbi:hypothetical protein JZ751_008161, partial [Albula glossodonta]